MKTKFACALVVVFALGTFWGGWFTKLDASDMEYRIRLDPHGMAKFAVDTGIRIYENVPGPVAAVAKDYCKGYLGLPKPHLLGLAESRNPNSEFTHITLCVAMAATPKYGYLCKELDMEFSRVEKNEIVCKAPVMIAMQ